MKKSVNKNVTETEMLNEQFPDILDQPVRSEVEES
jgi:hypothetical protein